MIKLDRKYLALLDAASGMSQHLAGLRTCFSLLALTAAIDRGCAERLQAYDLSEGRFTVLTVLLMAKKPLAPHDLAERIGVTRATMTGLLDGLERSALITRRRDRRDRRSVKIALTAPGRQLAERVNAEHLKWIVNLVGDLNNDEQADLQGLLARIWRKTDAASSAIQGDVYENN
ncbi:MAG: MarR family transcriptional regulator [Pseudomonadota bacterium]